MARCVTLLAFFLVVNLAHADPMLEKTDLFEAGKDGYGLYRIPGIVVTAKGTVLAYCEARKNPGGDWGQIDLALRRSVDGGKTWAPRRLIGKVEGKLERNPAAVKQKLGKDGEITYNNPVAIVDRKTGTVHFLFCVEYGRCFYMKSDDDGVTFSSPVEITATFEKFRPEYDWKVLATGPGHGIQLKSGRLLVPVWLSTGTGGHAHRPSCVSLIYSDDHGKTWQRGDIVAHSSFDNKGAALNNPSETVPVQLQDGKVLFNMRHETKPNLRAISVSPDGVTGWSTPKFHEELPEPICMASIIRYSEGPASKNRILFANPDNPKGRERKNVTIRLSHDEGQTWPVKKSLEPGPSGYSDLAVGPDGTIYCFYERARNLCVARFNLEWLTKE